jgi:zinc/manganese transport system substrate-binding protein
VPRARTTAVRTVLAVVAVVGLAACTDGGGDQGSAVATGNPDACPGEVVDVVVSVSQWGDVVRSVGGDCADVTTLVASGAVDPHDYEPGTADLAAISEAELVVVNGADYDSWAENAVASQDPEPAVLSVASLVDVTEGADPHLWYEPEAVHAVAPALADELATLSPDAADVFRANATTWQAGLRPYLDAVLALGSTASGRTYAATETVFDRMAAGLGLVDATPEGYRRSVGNESEPAPGDLAAFEDALANGSVDVLIYNTQTSGSVPEQLRSAAEDAGVPVVEVTESPSGANGSFLEWQLAQLSALSDALGEAP